jgi:hypothetical protein
MKPTEPSRWFRPTRNRLSGGFAVNSLTTHRFQRVV